LIIHEETPKVNWTFSKSLRKLFFTVLAIVAVVAFGSAATTGVAQTSYSAQGTTQLAQGSTPERQALFGDLHTHTNYSLDSYFGANPNGPREAYRFGRGEEVTLAGGVKHRLKAPLDFVAVTDHAEYYGEINLCQDPNSSIYNSENCQNFRAAPNDAAAGEAAFLEFVVNAGATNSRIPECGDNGEVCLAAAPETWQDIQAAAQEFNQPGKFTTFKAFEWTAGARAAGGAGGGSYHRNVIFRTDKVPSSAFDARTSNDPRQLWAWIDNNCTGDCEAIAIPHNSNLSGGITFAPENLDGTPLTPEIAATQQRLERLVEISQTKGESECKTGLGNTDELCGFEKFDPRPIYTADSANFLLETSEIVASGYAPVCDPENPVAGCVYARSYVREGLKEGLKLEKQLGVNPFKMGIIASTDTHNGTPGGVEEDQYKGHHGVSDNAPDLRLTGSIGGEVQPNISNNPGGLAGVWAEENTRDSIFAALQRREAFGTSGPRIQVRLFGGWNFPADLNRRSDMIAQAYSTGVPMGSDLPALPNGNAAPQFMVWATKDANSANLHGIQIIKGWLDANGETQEKVYAVVCSDGLQPKADGLCPLNGAQVDLTTCRYSTDVGAAELSAVWHDPDFAPSEKAFYYARVIENPTCRWSTYDAIAIGADLPDKVKPTLRERAWSSPIWYSPGNI
jgi:hypothetical protein